MGVEGPCYRGLLGRECHAFFESFGGGDGGAVGRECDVQMRREEEEEGEDQEEHGGG